MSKIVSLVPMGADARAAESTCERGPLALVAHPPSSDLRAAVAPQPLQEARVRCNASKSILARCQSGVEKE
eukprot:6893908-Pyramimonas_sp.AAC.1